MTPARLAAIDDLTPRHGIDPESTLDDDTLTERFGRRGERLLDIGVGNGAATLERARNEPDLDIVAVELHRPGIAQMLLAIDTEGLDNLAVLHDDVTLTVERIAPGTFTEVRILFPDPWPKARHRRRRLVDEGFVATIAALLPVGGRLHLATDWPDYADQMREAIAACPPLVPQAAGSGGGDADGGDATAWSSDRPERPTTAYERRGLRERRPITDLIAIRR